MSEPQKKPVWPWIVPLLIGLPVLYVVSFGPVCWLTAGPPPFEEFPHRSMIVYCLLGKAAMGEGATATALRWWIRLGTPTGMCAMVPTPLEWNHAVGFGDVPSKVQITWDPSVINELTEENRGNEDLRVHRTMSLCPFSLSSCPQSSCLFPLQRSMWQSGSAF